MLSVAFARGVVVMSMLFGMGLWLWFWVRKYLSFGLYVVQCGL